MISKSYFSLKERKSKLTVQFSDLLFLSNLLNTENAIIPECPSAYQGLHSQILQRYALAQSSEEPLSAVRVTLLCKSNVGDALVEGTFQYRLQETMWSNLNGDGIMWDMA
jgi:hypothetical protein